MKEKSFYEETFYIDRETIYYLEDMSDCLLEESDEATFLTGAYLELVCFCEKNFAPIKINPKITKQFDLVYKEISLLTKMIEEDLDEMEENLSEKLKLKIRSLELN